MIFTIDVGNSNIKFALYENGKLLHSFLAVTKTQRTEDELGTLIHEFLRNKKIEHSNIKDIIVSSVVPPLNDCLVQACKKYFNITPQLLANDHTSNLEIPLKIEIDHPSCLGADRIATSVGAINRYGKNLIIFNFGTATVCEVIGEDSDYLGGTISPGINTAIESLHQQTSLLPLYKFAKPSKTIATSLNDALYGGIFYATMGMVEKIVREVKAERPSSYRVIATGGLAHLVHEHTTVIDVYDPDLTTFGLYSIYLFNQK